MLIEELGIEVIVYDTYMQISIIDKNKFIRNYETIYDLFSFNCSKEILLFFKDFVRNNNFTISIVMNNDIQLKNYIRKKKITKLLKDEKINI